MKYSAENPPPADALARKNAAPVISYPLDDSPPRPMELSRAARASLTKTAEIRRGNARKYR